MKESIKLDHSGNIPGEIISVLTYACSLSFTQKPDYNHLWALLLPAVSFTLPTRAIAAMAVSQPTYVKADIHESQPSV